MTAIDDTRCPLCGGPNDCTLADPAGPRSGPCWCVAEEVPRALLGRVPADRLGKACLCRDCVRRARLGEDPRP
jgi:hypothetical protein